LSINRADAHGVTTVRGAANRAHASLEQRRASPGRAKHQRGEPVGLVVDSSIALIGMLAAAALGVLHRCQSPRDSANRRDQARPVTLIAILGALPMLVLGLLISRAVELAPR
jgi:hypothetical protein